MDKKRQEIVEELSSRLIKNIEADVLELEDDPQYTEVARELNSQPITKRYLDFAILYAWAMSRSCSMYYSISETKIIGEAVFARIRSFLGANSPAGIDLNDYIKDEEELGFFSQQFTRVKLAELTLCSLWDSLREKRFFDYNNAYPGSFKFFPVIIRFYKHVFGSDPKNDFNASVLASHFTGLLAKVFAIRVDSHSQEDILKYSKIIDTNPGYAKAYYNRAVAYFSNQEYDKSWKDIHKATALGHQIDVEFMEALKKASGREE